MSHDRAADERWTWLMEENFRTTKAELLAWINRHAEPIAENSEIVPHSMDLPHGDAKETDRRLASFRDSTCRDQGDENDS